MLLFHGEFSGLDSQCHEQLTRTNHSLLVVMSRLQVKGFIPNSGWNANGRVWCNREERIAETNFEKEDILIYQSPR